MQDIYRTIDPFDWITFILIGCIIIVTVLKVVYPKRFDDFIKLPISNNYFLTKGKFEELKHPFSVLDCGVDYISSGALTHSVINMDLSLKAL